MNTPASSSSTPGKQAAASGNTKAEQPESPSTGEMLREELSNLKSDLDDLVSRASNLTDEELRDAWEKTMAKFSSMRHAAKNMAAEANKHLNKSVDATTDYVKEKPLQSVAIATGVGLLLGSVLRR